MRAGVAEVSAHDEVEEVVEGVVEEGQLRSNVGERPHLSLAHHAQCVQQVECGGGTGCDDKQDGDESQHDRRSLVFLLVALEA